MVLPYDSAQFIDRDYLLDYLLKLVQKVQNGDVIPDEERIVHISGHARKGKTWLLKSFMDQLVLKNPDSIPLYVTCGGPASQDILGDAADKFSQNILNKVADNIGLNVDTNWTLHALSQNIGHHIKNIIKRPKVVVCLFDEVSLLPPALVNELEDYILAPMLYTKNTIFVLVGRKKITGLKDFSLRPSTEGENSIELPSFSIEYTRDQIQNRNSGAVHLQEKIFEISGGSPGKIDIILATAVQGEPVELNELEALRACNEDLRETVQDAGAKLPPIQASELLPALEALCVLQDFLKDYEMPQLLAAHKDLTGVWDARRTSALFSALCDIRIGPGSLIDWDNSKDAYAMEEQTRADVEQEIFLRDRELWIKLHCTAMNMYKQWATEYNSEIFAAKAEYHETRLIHAGVDVATCEMRI